jgi:hypothetical protein
MAIRCPPRRIRRTGIQRSCAPTNPRTNSSGLIPGAEKVNWEDDFGALGEPWFRDNSVMVAERWIREEVTRTILLMSDGSVLDEAKVAECKDYLDAMGITVVKSAARPKATRSSSGS